MKIYDKTTLSYHGKMVRVRKGMTVNANFFLMRRTLAQLLYDKVSNWLNPNDTQKANPDAQLN